jgi:hypothetical protein
MNPKDILALPRLPGRLNSEQTAAILGFGDHDIAVLVAERLLKPLGNPAHNAVKYFASENVCALAHDEAWLNKATKATYSFWAAQNKKRRDKHGALEPQAALAE